MRGQDGALTVYDVNGSVDEHRRIRLRHLIAELDPRVDAATWDSASHGYHELVDQTIADLTLMPAGSTVGASTSG